MKRGLKNLSQHLQKLRFTGSVRSNKARLQCRSSRRRTSNRDIETIEQATASTGANDMNSEQSH